MNNSKFTRKLTGILAISFGILLVLGCVGTKKVIAASDTTKPTLSVTKSTEEYTTEVTFTIKASDASGISAVKYAEGYQKTSYFKSNGTELSVSSGKASVTVTSNNTYTFYTIDKAGNTKIKRVTIENIDAKKPTLSLGYSVSNSVATISVDASDALSGIQSISYLKGSYKASNSKWSSAKDITGKTSFTVKKEGFYTVRVVDNAGNIKVSKIKVNLEMKAVWFSYLEYQDWCNTKEVADYTAESFTEYIDTAFDNVVAQNMNTVIVQVRPFGDAMYESKYFPWSQYASGTQGVDPGFDPLEIMVEEAHERNLEIQAWINPYRVTSASTDVSTLSDDNQAKIWLTDSSTTNDRNVLTYNGKLYYNPASTEVQKLIVNGIKEIVQNYDVDGIHFDDYFYPTLGSKYASLFDNEEYATYEETCTQAGKTAMTIANWRRNNVSSLLKKVYKAVKAIDSTCVFGISPAGAYKNLESDQQYYVDYKLWMSTEGYIDYICPQIYWSFDNTSYPFDDAVDYWASCKTNDNINLYIGIASYKYSLSDDNGAWKSTSILSDMVTYCRKVDGVDGFMFYRYAFHVKSSYQSAIEKLTETLAD